MVPLLISRPITNRRLKKLEDTRILISKEQTNLSVAYDALTSTANGIRSTIEALENQTFEEQDKKIDALTLDKDYKDKLKAELQKSKLLAIETLKPLQTTMEIERILKVH